MPRPGVSVSLLDTPGSALSVPTDTGVAFMAGLTERGPSNAAVVVYSLDDFVNKTGARVSYSVLYDSVEWFFKEGGYKAYIARVVGPAAASGSLNLMDGAGTPAISLVATALGAGVWSASDKIQIIAGNAPSSYRIHILDTNNVVVEDSGDLLTQADAIVWAQGSNYIRLALGVSTLIPAVAASTAMSAGSDDRGNITDEEWEDALELFPADLGPGQVLAPGRTSSTGHTQLIANAESCARVALLDLTDSSSSSTLTSAAGSSRYAASFAPWVTIPGLAAGSTRTVPPSAGIAGLLAKNDPIIGPNHPAAGNEGVFKYAIGLSQPDWDDATRETLNTGKVNVVRNIYGSYIVYGWRSGANPTTDRNWIDFGNARLIMALNAELNNAAQAFLFEEIDGQNGYTINAFHDALAGVCLDHFHQRELFGDTAEQTFTVDTGPAVNTLARLANLELHAIVYITVAPFAEYIPIQIVKRAIA